MAGVASAVLYNNIVLVVLYANFIGKTIDNITIKESSYHDSASHSITSVTSVAAISNYTVSIQINNTSAANKYCIIDMTIT